MWASGHPWAKGCYTVRVRASEQADFEAFARRHGLEMILLFGSRASELDHRAWRKIIGAPTLEPSPIRTEPQGE